MPFSCSFLLTENLHEEKMDRTLKNEPVSKLIIQFFKKNLIY